MWSAAVFEPALPARRMPAVGEHHHQIPQHDARVVRGATLAGRSHRSRERPREPQPVRGAGQQRAAGMPRPAVAVRPHVQLVNQPFTRRR
jgi:hypothetical protein